MVIAWVSSREDCHKSTPVWMFPIRINRVRLPLYFSKVMLDEASLSGNFKLCYDRLQILDILSLKRAHDLREKDSCGRIDSLTQLDP